MAMTLCTIGPKRNPVVLLKSFLWEKIKKKIGDLCHHGSAFNTPLASFELD
jgi:hypothetical protein